MVKIHFASVVSVRYDLDLAYYWVRHYSGLNIDTFKVFLHEDNKEVNPSVIDFYRNNGYDVEVVGGPYTDGLIRKIVLENYARNLPPDDFLVTADADEFQYGNCNPQHLGGSTIDYRRLEANFDIITGFLIDRYGTHLVNNCGDPVETYPLEEPWSRKFFNNFHPPYLHLEKFPYMRRTKVLAARCGIPVAFVGSHGLDEGSSNYRIDENYKVLHYAWRQRSIEKMALKPYYKRDHLENMGLEKETVDKLIKSKEALNSLMELAS